MELIQNGCEKNRVMNPHAQKKVYLRCEYCDAIFSAIASDFTKSTSTDMMQPVTYEVKCPWCNLEKILTDADFPKDFPKETIE